MYLSTYLIILVTEHLKRPKKGRKCWGTTDAERNYLIEPHNQYLSIGNVCKALGIQITTIWNAIERLGVLNKMPNWPRIDIRLLNQSQIVKNIAQNLEISAPQIANNSEHFSGIKLSVSEIRNVNIKVIKMVWFRVRETN